MSNETMLATLMERNSELFAIYGAWAEAQVKLLAGTIDDPDSFNAQGGKTGALGYYPVENVSGQTIYVPSLARLQVIAAGGGDFAAIEAILAATVEAKEAALQDANRASSAAADAEAYAQGLGNIAEQAAEAGALLEAAYTGISSAQAEIAASTTTAVTAAGQATAAAATPALAIQANTATPTVPPAGVANGAQYWAAGADRLTLYTNTAGVGVKANPEVTAPLGKALDDVASSVEALPVKEGDDPLHAQRTYSKDGGDIVHYITKDGKQHNLSGLIAEFLSSLTNRLRHRDALTGIDLLASGEVSIAGTRYSISVDPSNLLVIKDDLGHFVFSLRVSATETSLSAGGMVARFKADGSSEARTVDGTLLWSHIPGSLPVFNGTSGGVFVNPLDVYERDGEVLPVYADTSRIAGGGSSTIMYAATELATMAAGLGATYASFGDGGSLMAALGAQMGAVPALVTVSGGSIPASGPVSVTLATPNGGFGDMDATTGTLAGVYGTLSQTRGAFQFTRAVSGSVTAVPAGTPFVPERGPPLRNAIWLLNVGKNNIGVTPAATIAAFTHTLYKWLSPLHKKVSVIGHFVDTTRPEEKPEIDALNALLKAQFGAAGPTGAFYRGVFFDLAAWLASPQVWIDTGITPNQTSLDQQAAGLLPLQLSRGDAHMNDVTETALANKQIKPMMIALGWYKDPAA